MYPSYLKTCKSGKLDCVIKKTYGLLKSCRICPRKCGVNRLKEETGFCKTGLRPRVYSFMPHHGEEPPISGSRGSGTIFFSGCNMACLYCQNHEFSQQQEGGEVEIDELAHFMLQLQKIGCHNINLVTPTHVMPQILKALSIAIPQGLKIPIVYNTSGYELKEIIHLLNGIVDIYLPDARYADAKISSQYSSACDYPYYNQEALIEMHKQVSIAKINKQGIIEKGMIIRHLVLPYNIAGTHKIMEFIANKLSPDVYISLMGQYLPCYNANKNKDIGRRLTYKEYKTAIKTMEKFGLHNGWRQESSGLERLSGTNIKRSVT